MVTFSYILIFGMLGALSASVVWGLWWALKGGQFSNFQKGAASIFDGDEPVGQSTDTFPDAAASDRSTTSARESS